MHEDRHFILLFGLKQCLEALIVPHFATRSTGTKQKGYARISPLCSPPYLKKAKDFQILIFKSLVSHSLAAAGYQFY